MRTPVLSEKKPKKSRALPAPIHQYPPIVYTLFSDYNAWLVRCSMNRGRSFKPTDERLSVLSSMAGWCGIRKLDPRLWLYLLFRSRRWTWAPRLQAGHLMAEKHIAFYQEAKGLDGYRRHVLPQSVLQMFDPNADISPSNEVRKKNLLRYDSPERCMDLMVDETFGFHPRSDVCGYCPAAEKCKTALQSWAGFDILALRNGQITKAEAQRQAQAASELVDLPREKF